MFDSSSRYALLSVRTVTVIGPDGLPRQIRYVERRFLPPLDSGTTLLEHLVTEGERLDNITAKYLGDPAQFWRVADANDSLRPEELADEAGRRIVIKSPS